MIDPIKGVGVSDRSSDRRQDRREEGEHPHHPHGASYESTPGAAPGPDLRLMIERDAEGAYYIYRLVDRATGKVVAEHPRDEVANLAKAASYTAGSVVRTKA